MKEANPRARVTRLVGDRNYLGAQLYLKQAELEPDDRDELMGMLATAVVDELSRTRRDDRERIVFLRSILAWILREVPGLGSFYREQLRSLQGGNGLLPEIGRGFRNFSDVASGRKSVSEGISEAADDARRTFEDAADRMRTEDGNDRVNDFLSSAEQGIRQGLDQLSAFFRTMNANGSDRPAGPLDDDGSVDAAARADRDQDVEDAEFEEGTQEINVEREE